MSLEDKAKAAAASVEGKAKEVVGKITDNPELEAEGKAKQAEANVRQSVEDVKDTVKKTID